MAGTSPSSHSQRWPDSRRWSWPLAVVLGLTVVTSLAGANPAMAYVGPGAGLAVVGTAWTFLILILALFTVAVFPAYALWLWVGQARRRRRARAARVVVIGLDGLDPDLASQWMASGHLPNLQRLAHSGSFHPLGTTLPAITPAAWSSFSTGVDPSRHGIFDFVTRDPLTYRPALSSVDISHGPAAGRWAPWRRSTNRPILRSHRRSELFWRYLGRAGVFSSIVRMPITFPAEPLRGVLLSGMCVPDLRGTQGECTLFTGEADAPRGAPQGGTGALEAGALEARTLEVGGH